MQKCKNIQPNFDLISQTKPHVRIILGKKNVMGLIVWAQLLSVADFHAHLSRDFAEISHGKRKDFDLLVALY